MIRDLIFSGLVGAICGVTAHPKYTVPKSIVIGIIMSVVAFIFVHSLDTFRP